MTTSSSSSLSNLNDDVLCHALEYVNSYGVLHAMSSTNIRAHVLIEHSNVGARMERRLYLQEFGANDSLSSTTGFVARPYKALSNMKQKLLQQGNRDDDDRTSPPADKTTNLRTLGILSPKDENDATAYDHSFYFRENQQCIGYFGWKKLSEHNVVVWGDFEGIRILPTTLALSYHSHDQEDDGAIQKVGQSSSVLTVLVVPWSSNNNDEEENDHSKDSTLLFLGFASGKVSAVRCDPDGTFNTITETFKHTDEVTSLALLPNTATLVSGGMDGKVFLYPDACAKKPSLQNEKELSTPASVTKVLCLSATALNTHHVALCIFGEPQVTILHKHHTDETWKNDSRLSLHQPTSSSSARQIVSSEPKRATRVSMLKSSDDAVAVGIYGTNHGSLHKFEMRLNDDGDDDASRILFEDVITKSQAHLGAVDWIEVVGDVIFTSGGYQGMVQAWRVSDLSPLATIQAHPGRNFHPPPRAPQPQSPLTCSVVSIMPCHEQQSLTCLCRDGSIYQWKYANEEEESSQCVFGAAAFLRENYFEDDCQVTEIEEEEEYCKEKQPWTPERMDKFMENADAANRRRMQMRIMQAALHHGNESPPLAAMFDRHADVPQCHNCKSDGIGSYECRILQKHTTHLDLQKDNRQLSHVMFTKLKRNKNFWVDRGDAWWNCQNCHADNKTSRCFVCMSWKGGVRGGTKKRGGDEESAARPSKSTKLSPEHEYDGEIVKVWECYVCFHRNPWKKYSCQNCGRHAGGRRLEIHQDEMEDNFHLSVVSKSPKSQDTSQYWQCATCNTDNPMALTACSTCSSAPSKMSALEKLRAQQQAEQEANQAWSCRRCTFENEPSANSCMVCLKPRERAKNPDVGSS